MLEDLFLELLHDSVELTSKSIFKLGHVPEKLKLFYTEEDLKLIEEIELEKENELEKFIAKIDKNSKDEMNLDELIKYGKSTIRALELIPDPNECKTIYEVHQDAFERGIKKFENGTRNLGTIDGFMNLTRAGVSVSYDPILAGIYSLGAVLGMSSKLQKNKYSLFTAISSAIISTGAMALYYTGITGAEEMSPGAMFYLSVVDDFTTIPIIGGLGFYVTSKKRNQNKLNEIVSAIPNYERVMEHSIVIPEILRNLRYAKNSIRSNRLSKDFFDEDLNKLESIIRRYYDNDAEFEDVIESRLKYVPQANNKIEIKEEVKLPRKVSMSLEEYIRRKEAGDFVKFRSLGDTESKSEISQKEYSDEIGFTFVHERVGEIQGYPISRLEDLVQSKIRGNLESNGREETIKKSGNGAILIEQYQPEGPLYKMQPIGALRVLYSRNKNEIIVHDILSHQEYERKMS